MYGLTGPSTVSGPKWVPRTPGAPAMSPLLWSKSWLLAEWWQRGGALRSSSFAQESMFSLKQAWTDFCHIVNNSIVDFKNLPAFFSLCFLLSMRWWGWKIHFLIGMSWWECVSRLFWVSLEFWFKNNNNKPYFQTVSQGNRIYLFLVEREWQAWGFS